MPLLIEDLRLLLKHLFHPAQQCPVLWLHQRWIGGDQFFSGLLSLAEQGYVRGKVRHLQLGQAVLPPPKEVPGPRRRRSSSAIWKPSLVAHRARRRSLAVSLLLAVTSTQ